MVRQFLPSTQVFGNGGLLRHIKPWREETVDKRLRLIKVDHLLRHSCGWDVDQAPLYDPLRNKLYLARGVSMLFYLAGDWCFDTIITSD